MLSPLAWDETLNEVRSSRPLGAAAILQLVHGDITTEHVDAIVNAANAMLQHGGGVAGAIARAGGPSIQTESDEWVRLHGPISHAAPAWTKAGQLPATFIIHAVGPVWGEGDEDRKLLATVGGALRTADSLEVVALAMPAISTGIFRFPEQRAAALMLDAIESYFLEHASTTIKSVRIVVFDAETAVAFEEALSRRT